jgi:glutaredoxin
MTNIVLFTLKGCDHCNDLKIRLNETHIRYQEIEINQNKELWNQVVSQTGHNVLPTVFIAENETDEGLVYVPGRDYQSQDEIIEIIKKHI